MNSPQAHKSQVFIAGYKHFDLFYVPAREQIVSQFRLEQNYPWSSVESAENAGAPLENEAGQETAESPDENIR